MAEKPATTEYVVLSRGPILDQWRDTGETVHLTDAQAKYLAAPYGRRVALPTDDNSEPAPAPCTPAHAAPNSAPALDDEIPPNSDDTDETDESSD